MPFLPIVRAENHAFNEGFSSESLLIGVKLVSGDCELTPIVLMVDIPWGIGRACLMVTTIPRTPRILADGSIDGSSMLFALWI